MCQRIYSRTSDELNTFLINCRFFDSRLPGKIRRFCFFFFFDDRGILEIFFLNFLRDLRQISLFYIEQRNNTLNYMLKLQAKIVSHDIALVVDDVIIGREWKISFGPKNSKRTDQVVHN